MIDELARIAQEISELDPEISQALQRIADEITAYKKRGPQRKTRWHRRPPNERRKRRRWERTPGGRRYKRKKQRIEKRTPVKNYRKRLRNRGIHRKYPWLH